MSILHPSKKSLPENLKLPKLWSRLLGRATRLLEEQLYDQVVQELAAGQRRDGLWAKALANSDGLEDKAKALYIRYRVQSIKDETEIHEAIKEEADKARAVQLSDPVTKARNCGLSEDDIAYLGTPIEAGLSHKPLLIFRQPNIVGESAM